MYRKGELFTVEIEHMLIDMIRACPLLWDTTSPLYRRNDLKRQKWDEIATCLGPKFNGEMLRKRFLNIESTFRSNQRKVRESQRSGKGSDDVYVPKWELYKSLLFLSKTCAQSESSSNLPQKNHSNSEHRVPISTSGSTSSLATCSKAVSSESPENLLDIYLDDNTGLFTQIPCDNFQSRRVSLDHSYVSESLNESGNTDSQSFRASSPSPSLSSEVSKQSGDDAIFVKRGSKRKNNACLGEAVEVLRNIASQEIPPPPQQDNCDAFASFIASRLRSMSAVDRVYYEDQIMAALLRPRHPS